MVESRVLGVLAHVNQHLGEGLEEEMVEAIGSGSGSGFFLMPLPLGRPLGIKTHLEASGGHWDNGRPNKPNHPHHGLSHTTHRHHVRQSPTIHNMYYHNPPR